jgi:hypothetical protein
MARFFSILLMAGITIPISIYVARLCLRALIGIVTLGSDLVGSKLVVSKLRAANRHVLSSQP